MAKLVFTSEQEYSGYLKVNSCGKNYLTERDYNTLREKGRIDYSAYYVTKGVCYCHIEGKVIRADEGSVVLYFPKVRQHYSFKKEDNSEMLWAHFSGTACDIFKTVGLSGVCVIKIKDKKQFESAFGKMVTAHYKKLQYFDIASQGYMTVLLSLIAQSSAPIAERKTKISNENLEKVISFMYDNYNKPIDVKAYAKLCYVGEDHFIRVFKSYTGMTPYKYQLKIRIDRAVEMLEHTAISVSECAEVVGFGDNAYFSRVFKRFTGHTPSYYKK